ncbi:hypothetical protein [Streptomyces phyllanthi]|nr:hypothetical protein [Streptomyces phyllanthi]
MIGVRPDRTGLRRPHRHRAARPAAARDAARELAHMLAEDGGVH